MINRSTLIGIIGMIGVLKSLPLFSQSLSKFEVGGYFTVVANSPFEDLNGEEYTLWENYLNINCKYKIKKKWKLGTELIVSVIDGGQTINNPFFIWGTSLDYDLLSSNKMSLNLRGGISTGNLSFAGDEEPKKRFTINRIIGLSYDFKVYQRIWLYLGYYNHFPLNNIEFKYGFAQPFVGIIFKL